MHITNKLLLPQALVDAVQPDYNPADPRRDQRLSVTELTSPPRQAMLQRRHWDELEEDASDRIWLLLGKAVHMVLERASQNALAEQRLEMPCNGWTVSGQVDTLALHQQDGGGKGFWTLDDYKLTSVWNVKELKPEHEQQVNLYAHLARANNLTVERLRIIGLLRDWRKNESFKFDDYPAHQVKVLGVPLWEPAKCEAYMLERVKAHQAARFQLPDCTPEERWEKEGVWAVVKNGRAVTGGAKLPSLAAAKTFIARVPGGRVEERPGEQVRCSQYCNVVDHCEWARARGIVRKKRAA